jgi:hypothetical protein
MLPWHSIPNSWDPCHGLAECGQWEDSEEEQEAAAWAELTLGPEEESAINLESIP